MPQQPLRLFSWNINGLRAAAQKGFLEWLHAEKPDVLGVQEVRAAEDQLTPEIAKPDGFDSHFVAASRKGYSGVGLYSRVPAKFQAASLDATPAFGDEHVNSTHGSFDSEGRVQMAECGSLLIVNAYFPNGNGKARDNSRVPYKLEFYERVRGLVEPELKKGRPIVVMGDWNTAHFPIDLARPKQNLKTSGFLPEECAVMDRWMQAGWVDTFRKFVPAPDPRAVVKESKKKGQDPVTVFPEGGGHYTWWSQRFGVRAKNIGWRIDYILASPGAERFLLDAQIHPDVLGSDHCPISVKLDRAVLQA